MFLLVCKRNKELGETRKKWFGKQWRREDWRSTLTPNTQHPLIFRRKKKKPNSQDETKQNNNYYRNKGQGVEHTSYGGLVRSRRRPGKDEMRKKKKKGKTQTTHQKLKTNQTVRRSIDTTFTYTHDTRK